MQMYDLSLVEKLHLGLRIKVLLHLGLRKTVVQINIQFRVRFLQLKIFGEWSNDVVEKSYAMCFILMDL